jgi:DNA polymerase-3 subunit chi
MGEFGFYHLTRQPLERALPTLLETVLRRGHRVVLMTGSMDRVEALNGHLWTYEQHAWLPHGSSRDSHAAEQPVYLTTAEENPNGADVLVLVDGVSPAFMAGFARVVDMFDGRDDDQVAAARERWRAAMAAGHKLTYWQQGEAGGWEKKAEG